MILNRLAERLRDSRRAFALTIRSRDLRRAQLSFGIAWAAEWAFTVVLGVVAFRDGGAGAVGLVALLRMIPAAVLAPVVTALADRRPRDQVLIAVGLIRSASFGLCALVLSLGGPLPAVYALAMLQTVAVTVFRSAHSALLPALCRRPSELTSAAVVRGLLDSGGVLLGPLLAAFLLGVSGPTAVLLATAALSLWSAALLLGLRSERLPRLEPAPRAHLAREVAEGVRTIAGVRDLALLVGLDLVQTFTRGCFTVLVVVVAIELLDAGESGVGVLTGALGAGAVVGSLAATLLVSGHRLAAFFGVGVALWGLPIAVSGAFPAPGLVVILFALIGVGNALVDVGLYTLPARLVPDEVLGRVYGTLESLVALSVGVGAIVTPLVISVAGLRGAMVALGLVAPAAVLISRRRLHRIDAGMAARDEEIAALQRVPLLRPLPLPAIGLLALNLHRVEVEPGTEVFSQGDHGDRFYVIVHGDAVVERDGQPLRTLGAGASFGEIALLRDTVRTATVTAVGRLVLFVLERRQFVPVVTGYRASAEQAEATVVALMPELEDTPPGH